MKLQATISETQVEVEVREDDRRVTANVDGRSYDLELIRADEHGILLLDQGRVYDCRVDGQLRSGANVNVTIGARCYPVTLVDPKRLRGAVASGAHGDGAARVLAPMPGKVVRVLIEAGQQVEAGDGIVIVEAMKMQNEMKSPKAGVIASINVEVGVTVNGGDLL